MVLQVLFPDQTRVWSWYERDIADLLVFEHAEEIIGKVSAAMQNQTVCSEDNTVDITGCQPQEVHAGRSGRIINRSGETWSRPCPRPMHVRFLLTTSTFTPVTTSITFSYLRTSILLPTLEPALSRGTTILLSETPNGGKALTAESGAAESQVLPLATATEDLDLRPIEMESKLQSRKYIYARWNAIFFLLDAADIFFEARNNHEVEKNELLSIALRVLEGLKYHESIIIFHVYEPRRLHRSSLRKPHPHLPATTQRARCQIPLDHLADLSRQARRFSSLRPAPTCAALRRRCQGLR